MEFKDLFGLLISLKSDMNVTWTSFGAYSVVVIGILMQFKHDLSVRQKLVSVLITFFVCCHLAYKQLITYKAISIIDIQILYLINEEQLGHKAIELLTYFNWSIPFYYYFIGQLLIFSTLTFLICNNKVWESIRNT